MKRQSEKEGDENSVEITLGTLFSVLLNGQPTGKIDVIVDIGEDNYFQSAPVREDKDGLYLAILAFGGTGGSENFGRIVGQMTPEEVLKATQLGCRKLGFELPESVAHNLLAQKGSRRLILDR